MRPDMDIYGMVKVGERGQIVIPKKVRDKFAILPGEKLLVMGHDNRAIILMKAAPMKDMAQKILNSALGEIPDVDDITENK